MKLNHNLGIRIAGAGVCWPADLLGEDAQLDNDATYERLLGQDWQQVLEDKGFDRDKPQSVFGVHSRGWTRGSDIGSLELAIQAVKNALALADIDASEVDCIFSATCSPHQITSTLSGKIARQLGSNAMALDIRAGGAAGLDAMATAALYHQHGCKVSVVVASEVASQYLDARDLSNGLLFGDGAAAFVLISDLAAETAGLVGAVMGNADWQGKPFTVPAHLPPKTQVGPEDFVFQTPDATYRQCLADTWRQTAQTLQSQFADECRQLDAMLPYAVTRNQVQTVVEPFAVPCEASLMLLANHGCIGCASPVAAMALHWLEHHRRGKDQSGDMVGSMAVAGGISWAALLWRF